MYSYTHRVSETVTFLIFSISKLFRKNLAARRPWNDTIYTVQSTQQEGSILSMCCLQACSGKHHHHHH